MKRPTGGTRRAPAGRRPLRTLDECFRILGDLKTFDIDFAVSRAALGRRRVPVLSAEDVFLFKAIARRARGLDVREARPVTVFRGGV